MPKSLGGQGDKTNPEELFAAGYGACFQSAMNAVAAKYGLKMPEKAEESIIDTNVNTLMQNKLTVCRTC
jgi:organic hydroperoxide reductase OsmC/OhrA